MSVPNKYIYNSTHHKKKSLLKSTTVWSCEVHAPDTVHASIVSTFTETSGSLNQMK